MGVTLAICTFSAVLAAFACVLMKYVQFRNYKSSFFAKDEEKEKVIIYGKYSMPAHKKFYYILSSVIVLFFAGFLFFHNIYISIIFSLLSLIFPSLKTKDYIKKRKTKLNNEFKDALLSLASSLAAGRAVEHAFKAALADLRVLYPDENTIIIKEFELINRKIEMNETIEAALLDFSERADIEDITSFAEVFIICKSTGGNLVEVMKNTVSIIEQKIEIKNEIDILVAEQKISQRILNIMPFALLVLLISSSPEYVRPLYSLWGHIAMFIVLVLLVVSYLIGKKIMDIKV